MRPDRRSWALAIRTQLSPSRRPWRFLPDPDTDTVDTVINVDAFVDLPDGSTWALNISTGCIGNDRGDPGIGVRRRYHERRHPMRRSGHGRLSGPRE